MNLLLQPGWDLTAATNNPLGTFNGETVGVWSAETNTVITWNESNPVSNDDRLIGTVSWNISDPPASNEIWFHIVDRLTDISVFTAMFYQPGSGLPDFGSASFDVPASTFMQMTTSRDPDAFDEGIISYDVMGTFSVVAPSVIVPPDPDPDPETEVCLPWWLCIGKTPIVCPIRTTGFVLLNVYDTAFKFPIRSSRVASKIDIEEGCVVCAPNLYTPPVVIPPPPVCGVTAQTTYDIERTVIESIVGAPSWFTASPTQAFNLRFPGSLNGDTDFFFYYNSGLGGRHQTDPDVFIDFGGASVLEGLMTIDSEGSPYSTCILLTQDPFAPE